jgi:hypothetical protein
MLGSLVLIVRRENLLAGKLGIDRLERKNQMLGSLLLAVPKKETRCWEAWAWFWQFGKKTRCLEALYQQFRKKKLDAGKLGIASSKRKNLMLGSLVLIVQGEKNYLLGSLVFTVWKEKTRCWES